MRTRPAVFMRLSLDSLELHAASMAVVAVNCWDAVAGHDRKAVTAQYSKQEQSRIVISKSSRHRREIINVQERRHRVPVLQICHQTSAGISPRAEFVPPSPARLKPPNVTSNVDPDDPDDSPQIVPDISCDPTPPFHTIVASAVEEPTAVMVAYGLSLVVTDSAGYPS